MTPNPTPVSTVDVRPGYEQRAGAHDDPRLEWWRHARFGVYYSQAADWRHPDGLGNDWDYDPAAKNFDRYRDAQRRPDRVGHHSRGEPATAATGSCSCRAGLSTPCRWSCG